MVKHVETSINSFSAMTLSTINALKVLPQASIHTVVAAAKTICQRIISLANSIFAAIYHYWHRKNIAAKNSMREPLALLKNYQPYMKKEYLKDLTKRHVTSLEQFTQLPDNSPEILKNWEVLKKHTTSPLTEVIHEVIQSLWVEINFTINFLPKDSPTRADLSNLVFTTNIKLIRLERQKLASIANLDNLRLNLETAYNTFLDNRGTDFAREFLSPHLENHKAWAVRSDLFSASDGALTFNFSPDASNRAIFKEYRRYLRSFYSKLTDIENEFNMLLRKTPEGPDQMALQHFKRELEDFDLHLRESPHNLMKNIYSLYLRFNDIKRNSSSQEMLT